MSDEDKKVLHDAAVDDAADLEVVAAGVAENHAELKKRQDDYDAFAGPSSFPKLVSQRRKEGILLPFKVNLTKGSEFALTTWPEDLEEKASDRSSVTTSVPAGDGLTASKLKGFASAFASKDKRDAATVSSITTAVKPVKGIEFPPAEVIPASPRSALSNPVCATV